MVCWLIVSGAHGVVDPPRMLPDCVSEPDNNRRACPGATSIAAVADDCPAPTRGLPLSAVGVAGRPGLTASGVAICPSAAGEGAEK